MASSPNADQPTSPRPAPPVMFQEPKRGPGRPPSATSTNSTPNPSGSAESPTLPVESSTTPGPSWSTEPLRGDAESVSESSTAGRSPGSGDGPSGDALERDIRAFVDGFTGAAHEACRDELAKSAGQFLATDEELDGIAEGAANIAARRVPAALGNRDVGDLISIGAALFSYGVRQVKIWRAVRAARRQMESANSGQTGGESSV